MKTIEININEFKAELFNAVYNNAKSDLKDLLDRMSNIKSDLFGESYNLFDTKSRLECITEIHFKPLYQQLAIVNAAIEINKKNLEEIAVIISAAKRVLDLYN